MIAWSTIAWSTIADMGMVISRSGATEVFEQF